MTTEPTIPQPELGRPQANGQGQSQGHRRRRRRRKNKSNQQGGQPQGRFSRIDAQQARPQMQAPQQPSSRVVAHPSRVQVATGKEEILPAEEQYAPPPAPGNSICRSITAGAKRDKRAADVCGRSTTAIATERQCRRWTAFHDSDFGQWAPRLLQRCECGIAGEFP